MSRRLLATLLTAAVLVFAQVAAARRIGKEVRDEPSSLWVHQEDNRPRLAALAEALPPRGAVGFLGAQSGQTHFDRLGDPILQQLQYELAPRLVVNGAEHEAVVVVFPDGAAARAACAAHGLTVVKDLGGGVLLARRAP